MTSLTAERELAADCCAPLMGAGLSPEEAGATAALFKALADPTRVSSRLGCRNPMAVADLNAGEVVLDLGSGGGIDVLLSARRVGPTGKAYGLAVSYTHLTLPTIYSV